MMPEGGEEKIVVQEGFNGEKKEFANAEELKDYMCHNGYGHIAIGTKSVGLNDDDIDTVLGEYNKVKCLLKNSSTEEKEKAIGEGIIYLNPHLNDEQKGKIREQFNAKLEDITELNLEGFGFKALPESIEGLKFLLHLNLNNNEISALPESIGGLEALRALHLRSNKLSALPDSFGNLRHLVMLGLDNNQLEKLPDSFEKLTGLVRLNLDNNKLIVLPHSIRDLSELSTMNNPLKNNFNKIPKSCPNSIESIHTINEVRGV